MCTDSLSVLGAVLPTNPWGRLAPDPHFTAGKTETQRADVICHTASKCQSGDSNPECCDPQASPPHPFTNLPLHVPQGLSQIPNNTSQPPGSLHPSGSPATPGDGGWTVAPPSGKICASSSLCQATFLPSQGGRWPGPGLLSCPRGWGEA